MLLSLFGLEETLVLLEELNCKALLVPAETTTMLADQILSRKPMRKLEVPSLENILKSNEGPLYPFRKAFSQAKDEPFVALHTSGSTGPPKPAVLKHGTVAHHDLFVHASELGGKGLNMAHFSGKRVLLGLPFFHSASICFLAFAIYSQTVPVLLSSPVSAETINEAHLHAAVDASFLGPSTITDITHNPEYMENLKRLQFLTFGGSPLQKHIGDKVKDITHLFVSFGTTECGFYALEETAPDDWEYVSFSPMMGYELRPIAEDYSEFFFKRKEGNLQVSQGVFSTFPDIQEYTAKDLFSKHPSKENLWLYEGRTNDIIRFSDYTNYFPQPMEKALNAHPIVRTALVYGEGRPCAAILIEAHRPPSTPEERESLLEEIWPTVEVTNRSNVASMKEIARSLVLFTEVSRPMARASKGSVMRQQSIRLYAEDLDRAYRHHVETSGA